MQKIIRLNGSLKLRVLAQLFRRRRRQRLAGINRFVQRLGAIGAQRPRQPAGIQRFGNQIQSVCGDRRLLLHPGRVADTDKEPGQQQCGANSVLREYVVSVQGCDGSRARKRFSKTGSVHIAGFLAGEKAS